MRRLAILGAGGHGKVVADAAECCGWQFVEFFDDSWPDRQENGAWSVVGNMESLQAHLAHYDGVVVAVGDNRVRYARLLELRRAGAPLATLIHPAACVSRYARLGDGSVVFAGAVVNAFAQVGEGCILNTQCIIEHDCILRAAVHVSPGASLAGGVEVGEAAWIGIGASVRQLVRIGADVVVGAGAAVVGDVSDSVTVVGVPARII